jgi:zinc/manganese transport system permease protein
LTARPLVGIAVSVGIGVAVTWLGLACSYFTDQPVGFFVTTFAFAAYLLAHAGQWAAARRRVPVAPAGATR